jgi:uncharacterized membrane protein YkoI
LKHFNKRSLSAALLAALLAAVASATFAANNTKNDAASVAMANISLSQAVAVAEQYVNGKVARAEYANSKQGGVYAVEIVSGVKVFDINVDADKGVVISSAQDTADRDDEHDKND